VRDAIVQTICVVLFCLLTVTAFSASEEGERKSFIITRTESPPVIDGRLDDPAWLQAAIVDDFQRCRTRFDIER
jgi:hypothetical protein